jgi:signal recognition particle receptor subunit beta
VNPDTKGKVISLATETERTLFFDFLPIDRGEVSGFKTRFHLYTVPSQVYYNASRKLIPKGVDGIIFVADSQQERAEANIEVMHNLYENIEAYGYDVGEIPFATQFNKRYMPNAMPAEEIRSQINPTGVSDFEGVAIGGKGVFETLKSVSKMVVTNLS